MPYPRQLASFTSTRRPASGGVKALIGACISTGILFAPVGQAAAHGHSSAHNVEFRSFDGSNNNPIDSTMGQAFTPLVRSSYADYADGVAALAGTTRPGPRTISNALGNLPQPAPPARGPSDFVWTWGQFIDHDITLSESAHPDEYANISVPTGDNWFDPTGSGSVVIPFRRSIHDSSSGTDVFNPRQQVNQITSWIDASNVYGSDAGRANALRRNDGSGKLKTSQGNFLPFNTDGLPNAGGTGAHLFIAGDIRANEQVGLTSLHTLFVREHNRLATRIHRRRPKLDGDQIYQRARRIVGAQLQYITYKEYLPVLLGRRALPRYRGYIPWTEASIVNEFSTALYRFGHSAVGPQIKRLNRRGRQIRHGHLAMKDAFFTPQVLVDEGGIAPVLRGLAAQTCQKIDLRIADDLRNFLFGQPGSGGMDLASLNIQRGRDHGLSDYNATRIAYGLAPAATFADISADSQVQQILQQLYQSVDDIDLWVGALAEDTYAGMVGELMHTAIAEQFTALRDGDRFWYKRTLNRWEKRQVTRLSRIIKRNTPIGRELRYNVFINR